MPQHEKQKTRTVPTRTLATLARPARRPAGEAKDDLVLNETLAPAPPAPALVVKIDGEEFDIDPERLADPEVLDELRQRVQAAADGVEFRIVDLPGWSDDSPWLLFQFLAGLRNRFQVAINDHLTAFTKVFDAVLTAMEGDADIARCERGRRAAVQAACLFHRKELQAACSRIAKRLGELKVKGFGAKAIQEEAKDLLDALQSQNRKHLVREAMPDAPVPETAIIPGFWEISDKGMVCCRWERAVEIGVPVLIAGALVDIGEGTESLQLAWKRDKVWERRVVDRNIAANSRRIVELADCGFPVTSNNAAAIVRYLSDYEDANREVLPKARVSRRLGWQGNGGLEVFLWGKKVITADGRQDVDTELSNTETWTPETLIFRGADAGDEQLADGFHARGEDESWLEVMQDVVGYPRVMLGLYVSFVPALLPIIQAANFVLDYAGETTNGKTTTQRVAASVWGNPDERSPSATLTTWDSTRVHRERMAATYHTLPVNIDDTKRAPRPTDVAQAIYDVTSGRARGRGSLKGTQRSDTFITVMITSGEAPATSFTQDAGTRARVLCLWGSPFGQRNPETAAVVNRINQGIREHYGHAGPRLVEHLLRHRERWTAWLQQYQHLQRAYTAKAADHPFGARMAGHFAAITLTAQLVHEAINLPWPFMDPVVPLWDDLLQEASEADRASRALGVVMDWAHAHAEEFYQSKSEAERQPARGWAGRWDRTRFIGDEEQWEIISFFPEKLKEILEESGFEFDPILRAWRDRGWVIKDADNRARHTVRIAGGSVWVVGIPFSTMQALETAPPLPEPVEPDVSDEELRLMIPPHRGHAPRG